MDCFCTAKLNLAVILFATFISLFLSFLFLIRCKTVPITGKKGTENKENFEVEVSAVSLFLIWNIEVFNKLSLNFCFKGQGEKIKLVLEHVQALYGGDGKVRHTLLSLAFSSFVYKSKIK